MIWTDEEFNERQNKVEMKKQKCPSYFGDYKCHVKTNVKDSRGNFVYVDKCLKEAVENLNAVGLKTVASCCGHGIINPHIAIENLSDGKPETTSANSLHKHIVNNCACSVDETTGWTQVKCCNICGRPLKDQNWHCC